MANTGLTITGESTTLLLPVEGTPKFNAETTDLASIINSAQREWETSKSDTTLSTPKVSIPSLTNKKLQWIAAAISCTLLFAGVVALSVYLMNKGGNQASFGGLMLGIVGGSATGSVAIWCACRPYTLSRDYINIDSQKGRDAFANAILHHRTIIEIENEIDDQRKFVYTGSPPDWDDELGPAINENHFVQLLIDKETNEGRKTQYQEISKLIAVHNNALQISKDQQNVAFSDASFNAIFDAEVVKILAPSSKEVHA